LFYKNNLFLQEQGIKGGCGAKIIFPQFDTIILVPLQKIQKNM
jgi:hypothetical protein